MRNGAGNVCATGSWSSPISTSTSTRIPALVLPMPNSLCHSPLPPSSPARAVAPVPVQLPVGLHQNSNETQRSPICRCLNPYRNATYIPYHTMPCHAIPCQTYTVYMLSWRTFAPRPIPLMSVNQGNCYFFNNFSLALCLSRERLSYESRNPAQSQSQS